MNLRLGVGAKMASVQGAPKIGLRRFGVPPGGPWDRESAWLANALLGNPIDAPVLEWALSSLEFQVLEDTWVAIVGVEGDAGRMPAVRECGAGVPPALVSISIGQTATQSRRLPDADKLLAVHGARAYLALPGGVIGVEGGVRATNPYTCGGTLRLDEPTESRRNRPIRVTPGPQADLFDLKMFPDTTYEVHPQSNRMGIRLSGEAINPGPEIVSEPACAGAIQIDNSGQPIILGPDGPTIGGYPKIAVVCDADLDHLAQLRPGQEISFQVVSFEQAAELRYEWKLKISRRLAQIAAAREAIDGRRS